MATLTITANAKTASETLVHTARVSDISKETATVILSDDTKSILSRYGGREKFGIEWQHQSDNTIVVCYVKRGVEVVVTATYF